MTPASVPAPHGDDPTRDRAVLPADDTSAPWAPDPWSRLALDALGVSAWLVNEAREADLVVGRPQSALPSRTWAALAIEASDTAPSTSFDPVELPHVTVGSLVVSRTVLSVVTDRSGTTGTLVMIRACERSAAPHLLSDDDPTELRSAVERWASARGVADLSTRELDIVTLMVRGHRIASIATMLFLSSHTVRNHLKSVFRKLDLHSQAELVDDFRRATGRERTTA